MKDYLRLAFLCCLTAMIFAGLASCDRETCCDDIAYIISGKISDSSSGLPIDSAIITWGDTTNSFDPPFLTDSNGRYTFPLNGSRTTVYARRAGYETGSRALDNVKSDIRDVDIKLLPM